jgi:MFS superfamily sulfate permease-like transporter
MAAQRSKGPPPSAATSGAAGPPLDARDGQQKWRTVMVPAREAAHLLAGAGTQVPLAGHVTHDGGTVVVRLRGALTGARVPLLETVLHRLETRGRGRLTLDLRDLEAIDAAGAAMVHRSVERALVAGRTVSVLGDDVAARPDRPIPIAEAA